MLSSLLGRVVSGDGRPMIIAQCLYLPGRACYLSRPQSRNPGPGLGMEEAGEARSEHRILHKAVRIGSPGIVIKIEIRSVPRH